MEIIMMMMMMMMMINNDDNEDDNEDDNDEDDDNDDGDDEVDDNDVLLDEVAGQFAGFEGKHRAKQDQNEFISQEGGKARQSHVAASHLSTCLEHPSCVGAKAFQVGFDFYIVCCVGAFPPRRRKNSTYLGSIISSSVSVDTELNTRIGKTSAAMACLSKRVWESSMLTINTKTQVYQVCLLSTFLYGSESWTLYTRQECSSTPSTNAASKGSLASHGRTTFPTKRS
ncbi:hypothetical protein PoB_004916300 [Plakobranchus ocellatus]|uniref:Uncharacterized protein n=1 Tax=Plakobranchus ocellatus TaxID=259542 RepID=A0AAV4BSS8_9GAST|nr:hypothetical protein PoB_004916300 [Plakobranchus ocellatus]